MEAHLTKFSDKVDPLYVNKPCIEYHERQFAEPYRSTVHLIQFLKQKLELDSQQLSVLDVACGAGANILHLSRAFPHFKWTGLELSQTVIDAGTPYLRKHAVNADLRAGDLYRMHQEFSPRSFDLVLFLQTYFSLEHAEEALDQLLKVSRGWVVISSLFTEFPIDAKIQAFDYSGDKDRQGPFLYNIYSLPRFEELCRAKGATQIIFEDFEMDIDIAPPPEGRLGTYTRRLENQKRLQFSGPILMPWKIVAIRMP